MTIHAGSPSADRVVLRDVTEDDIPIFFEHQLNPEANRMAGFTARDLNAVKAHWTKILGDQTIVARTILVEGQVAGNIVSSGSAN